MPVVHPREPPGPLFASWEASLSAVSHFSWTKVCVGVGRAEKLREGWSKLVPAQKPLEGLLNLSKLQHFTALQSRPRTGRGGDLLKAVQPAGMDGKTACPCPRADRPARAAVRLDPQPLCLLLLHHGVRSALKASRFAPSWVPRPSPVRKENLLRGHLLSESHEARRASHSAQQPLSGRPKCKQGSQGKAGT